MSEGVVPVEPNLPQAFQSAPYSPPRPAIPEVPALTSRTYSSPMSYVGSARRTMAWVRKVGGSSPVAAGVAWTVGVSWIAFMWLLVLPSWYFVTLIVFGWFMIPFRLIRRSHRKQEHVQAAQLATMQAMMVQQHAILRDREVR